MDVTKESVLILCAFSLVNVLNYFHRYIPSATKVLIQHDLHLSDFQTGFIFTSFIISYMLVSPLVGWIGDKKYIKRKYLLVGGVILWSFATSITALCNNFYTFLLTRILFGIGEATYCTLSSPLLSDFFVPSHRNIVMGIFNAAIPIGCAIGYAVAGPMAQHLGWRLTFAILGTIGIFSLALLLIREPDPGETDIEQQHLLESENTTNQDSLLNRTYIISVIGFVAVTFGMGGLSDWLPTFFVRYYGMSVERAGLVNGCIVVAGGLFGAIIGSLVSEKTKKYIVDQRAYFLVSGVSMAISTILASLALFCCQNLLVAVLILFWGATFFGWWYNGPINGTIQNCVSAKTRSRANGICILCIHMFGDAISPSIIGVISDNTQKNLRFSLIIVPISFGISSIAWLIGCIYTKTNHTSIKNTRNN
jgi:MFS family permease